jgi:hypothetical protein
VGVTFGADSFSFRLCCWAPGEAAAGGEALGRREEAVVAAGGAPARHEAVAAAGGAPARHEAAAGTLVRREVAVGGALARCEAMTEAAGEIRGPPVVVPWVSEPAAGRQVYVQPGAQQPEHGGPVVAAF